MHNVSFKSIIKSLICPFIIIQMGEEKVANKYLYTLSYWHAEDEAALSAFLSRVLSVKPHADSS